MNSDNTDNISGILTRHVRNDRRALLGAMGGVVAGAILAGSARAGELNPPGAPTPTMKPLNHVEPRIPITQETTPGDSESIYRIEKPGSYYLTENLIGLKGMNGIMILAEGVTIDLMGFVVQGKPDSRAGICNTISAGLSDLRIVNGIVRDWTAGGISLASATGIHVACVHSSSNGDSGFHVGTNAVVESCTASTNKLNGIQTNGNACIIRCAAIRNSSHGIQAGNGSTVSDCCAVYNNGTGIAGDERTNIRGCTANSNDLIGISSSSCSIINCEASSNMSHGIRAGGRTLVQGNIAATNSEAGIYAINSDNRIEGNNCSGNERGIHVPGAGNFIVRNTCSGSSLSNWLMSAGNTVGTIIAAPFSGVINGDTGGAGVGSVDPWANFTY